MASARPFLQRWLPVAVTLAALAFLALNFDLGAVYEVVTAQALVRFVPVLLVYTLVSLLLEARSLRLLVPTGMRNEEGEPVTPGIWTFARIKAASYPLAIVNYALGGVVLTILLRRRAGMSTGDSAGVVLLIAALDLGVMLALAGIGAASLQEQGPALQAGVVIGGVIAVVFGLVIVRGSMPLGPLEGLRQHAVFRAARDTPMPALLKVVLTRGAFIAAFITLAGGALWAFDIAVPLAHLVVSFAAISLVAVLPIAVAGLGTGQVAFVYLLKPWGQPEHLLACSLTLSAGILITRATLGLLFAREFTREGLAEAQR